MRGSGRLGAGCCRWEAMTPAGSSCTLHCTMTRGSHSTLGLQSTGLACLACTSIPLAFGFTSLASCTGSGAFLGCTFSICRQSCGERTDILPVMLLTTVRKYLLCSLFSFFWWHGRSEEQALQITYYIPRHLTATAGQHQQQRRQQQWQQRAGHFYPHFLSHHSANHLPVSR